MDEIDVLCKIRDFNSLRNALSVEGFVRGVIAIARGNPYNIELQEFKSGAILFRARIIDGKQTRFENQDFWEPHPKYVVAGRANKKAQPKLYCSIGDPITALAEIKAKAGDRYLLTIYQSVDDIFLSGMSFQYNDAASTFLSQAVSIKGKSGHAIAEQIIASLFNVAPDGAAFPSTAYDKGRCVCLNLTAKNKLNVIYSIECIFNEKIEQPNIRSIFIFDEAGDITTVQSEDQNFDEAIKLMWLDVQGRIKAYENKFPLGVVETGGSLSSFVFSNSIALRQPISPEWKGVQL
jgi:RES domain.